MLNELLEGRLINIMWFKWKFYIV